MSVPADLVLTNENCNLILEEALGLLELTRQSEPRTARLNFLLANHFASNDFRSYCCFGHAGDDVSLEVFNSLCILPNTDWVVHLDSSSSTIQPAWADSPCPVSEKFAVVSSNISILFWNVLKTHPESELITSLIPRNGKVGSPWILAILGRNRNHTSGDFSVPPLHELRRRISLSLDASLVDKRLNPLSKFFSSKNGFLWQTVDDSFDVNKVYLEVCSEFPLRLEKLLQKSGKTLDELAGVEVVQRYPEVEDLVRDALLRGQQHGLESFDMKLADGSLGGTVFAIHNAHYSVEWIAAYLVDTDNNVFMDDVRAASMARKERLLRIFSNYHTADNPSWVQFGTVAKPFVYLSRLASAAEQGFLKIQSYVINLLVDDINSRLKLLDTHGKFQLEYYHYDIGVVSLGNPTTSSLAEHQDGKPGIVCPHTLFFSRFMLMVPTMAFQNHCGPTATVSWFRSDDPKKVEQASFTHDFFINHFQLMQVNDKFHHQVSFIRYIVLLFWVSLPFLFSFLTHVSFFFPGIVPRQRRCGSSSLLQIHTCGRLTPNRGDC